MIGVLTILVLIFVTTNVLAHAEDTESVQQFSITPFNGLIYTVYIMTIVIIASVIFRNRMTETAKKIAFLAIIIPVILSTAYLAIDTINLNLISETGGPIHWHADFEIWACDQKIQLASPDNILDNKVGTPILHHHSDDRMHVEGTLLNIQEADLFEFFRVIDGEILTDRFRINTVDGSKSWINGDICPDGNPGTLQVFVYKTNGSIYTQEKLLDAPEYVPSPFINVPPGDCIIIDFDSEIKDKTDHICTSYAVAIENGEIYGS